MRTLIYSLTTLFLLSPFLSFTQSGDWIQLSAGTKMDFDAIYFFDDLKGFIGGGFGNTYATTDGGQTWSSTSNQGFRDYDFYDDEHGFGASIVSQSMGYTSNGGASWVKITPPTSNSLWSVAATGPRSAYFTGTGGVLWKTEDGGGRVTVLNSGTNDLLTDMHFFNDDAGIIVRQSDGLSKTTNGGLSWKMVYDNTSQRVTFTEMHFVDSKMGFVLGNDLDEGGFVLKTTDGGETWSKINIYKESKYLYGIDFFDENHGLVVGNKGEIYYTNNGGTSWNKQLSDKDSTNLADVHMFSGSSAIIIGDNGMILLNNSIELVNSISEQSALSIEIFPNPAQQYFLIQSNERLDQLEIIDLNGQVCQSIHPNIAGSIRVDIATLREGIYMVVGTTESRRIVARIIKT